MILNGWFLKTGRFTFGHSVVNGGDPMKLIIIHGAPAAGKLTVATELGVRTGFKVFHNHLSIDCVKPVFDFGTLPFLRMIELIRFGTIAEAAREGVDIIHTFVYAFGEDDEHMAKLIASAEDNGGEVHLVLLVCELEALKERIGNESRVRIGKLASRESVDRTAEKYEVRRPFPGRETLVIDTSCTTPDDAAELIIERFGLRRAHRELKQINN